MACCVCVVLCLWFVLCACAFVCASLCDVFGMLSGLFGVCVLVCGSFE